MSSIVEQDEILFDHLNVFFSHLLKGKKCIEKFENFIENLKFDKDKSENPICVSVLKQKLRAKLCLVNVCDPFMVKMLIHSAMSEFYEFFITGNGLSQDEKIEFIENIVY